MDEWKPKSQPLYESIELEERVSDIADQLNDYFTRHPHLIENPPLIVIILNGAIFFAADLMKKFTFDFNFDALKFSSYENNEKQASIDYDIIKFERRWARELKDRSVVIIEDIVDTGDTMKEFLNLLQNMNPLQTILISLFERKGQNQVKVGIRGFTLDTDAYIYGYGLDNNGTMRHLTEVYRT